MSERTNCRVLTGRGRFSGLGPGEAPCPPSLLGPRPAPAAPDGRAASGRTSLRRREGVCDVSPGPRADRLAAARGPSEVWFRFLFRRRGAGSTGRPTRNCRDSPPRARPATACGARARWVPGGDPPVGAEVREVAEGARASPPTTEALDPRGHAPGGSGLRAGRAGGGRSHSAARRAPEAEERPGGPRGASAPESPEGRGRVGDESRRVQTRPRPARRWSGR